MDQKKILCMDLLNYLPNFFTTEDPRVDFEMDMARAHEKVFEFVTAVKNSGFNLECFVDKAKATEETIVKWKARRMKQMESGVRNCVGGASKLLGDMFRKHGIHVHYSTIDCDDTISAFAFHSGGGVLSRDCDFFRYYAIQYSGSPPYQVYFDFAIIRDHFGRPYLQLNPHGGPGRNRARASPRRISTSLPDTKPDAFFLDYFNGSHFLQIGCGSNLTQLTNPSLQVRPLRQAVYKQIGVKSVNEMIASWSPSIRTGTFTDDCVKADGKLKYLLDNPTEAFKALFGRSKNTGYSRLEWKNHIYCQKVAVAETCAWSKNGNIHDMLALMVSIQA